MGGWSRALPVLGALPLSILIACSGDPSGPDCDAIASALVTRIEVRPAVASVDLGDSLQLQAVPYSCSGSLGDLGAFHWRSGDPTVATVGVGGLVMAVSSGRVAIYAALRGKEGFATVTAEHLPVARVTVEPASGTLGVGRTSRLTARALDPQGREIVGRPVTWSSAASAIVAVGVQGDITGGAVGGPVAVRATIEGKSASSMITVVQVPVSTVVVTPALSTLAAGRTLQLSVTLRDDLNNPLTGRTVNWTSSDPAIASISGAGGLVTGLKPGTVTLTATSEGKSGTAQVAVILGAPARLHFVQQPSPAQAGSVITPAVGVEIQDAAGNRVLSATLTVSVALATPGAAVLGGTLSVNAVNGLAIFGNLAVDVAGSYSLTAASAGLASATSASFAVTARPATRLAFQQQPLSTIAGTSLGTVTVELQDATGARVTGQAAPVTLALGINPGGATLSGTLTRTSVNGLATFAGLSLDRAGTGYTLTATASGLGGATSSPFTIAAGPPSQLKFMVQPCPAACPVATALVPAPQVAVQDALGNTVTGSTATISLTLKGGGKETVLSGTKSRAAVAGIATFPDLTINRAVVGLTLRAASGGLSDATSAAFDIVSPGP